MDTNVERALLAGLQQLNLDVDAPARARLLTLLDRMLAANRQFNLTSVTDPLQAVERHLLDSLSGLAVLSRLPEVVPLIDVGTGAGFPGMALACVKPEWPITLVDSTRKKTDFLRETAAALGLDNVTVLWARAESLGRDPGHRERYVLATARALAPLPVLLEYLAPLVRVGGWVLAYKGRQADQELEAAAKAMRLLHLTLAERVEVRPDEMDERPRQTLLLFQKLQPTPPAYPRRPGLPAKRPL